MFSVVGRSNKLYINIKRGDISDETCFLFVLSGMAAVHPPIVQGATIPLIPEKKVENGIESERGNTGTRKGTARTPILIDIRGRGSPFNLLTFCKKKW